MTLLVTDEPKIHCSIQDCLLQGQAQLDQRAGFLFLHPKRLRSKKEYPYGAAHQKRGGGGLKVSFHKIGNLGLKRHFKSL